MAKTVISLSTDQLIDNLYLSYKNLERRVDWGWFKNLWLSQADEYQYFELAKTVNPFLTFELWDRAWQYRTVNHENYKEAQSHFITAILGWY